MGRLFWKFFGLFWLAQAATVLLLGLLFGLLIGSMPPFGGPPPIEQSSTQGHSPMQEHPVGPPPLPLIAGVFVSLAFAAWLSWYLARPIRVLHRAFEALAEGELNTRVGDKMGHRKDELAELGIAFDRSAAKLESMVLSKQRLLHDVSHELRSPLARLQAYGDLLVQQPERTAELVKRIERETGRMDKLVGELLTLARLESTGNEASIETVDLIEIVQSLRSDTELDMQAKSCRLQIQIPVQLQVEGNAELLYRALDNLLRNAVQFSPVGGVIELRIAVDEINHCVQIRISDEGAGVHLKEVDRIFEPFFRGDSMSDTGPHGSGLGLAITRSVVLAHQGKISARNRVNGGLEVTISLPARSS